MMNKKTFFWIFGIVIFGIMGIFLCPEVLADSTTTSTSTSSSSVGNSIFSNAYDQLYTTFKQARVIVYLLSGFGLIGFAVAAIFNKISFTWLTMIGVALFTLAAADKIVNYVVTAGSSTTITNENPKYEGDSEFNLDGVDNSFNLEFNNLL